MRVDDLTTGTTNLFNNATAGGNEWAPTADLVRGHVVPRLGAGGPGGSAGAWSDPADFTVRVAEQVRPARDGERDLRPDFLLDRDRRGDRATQIRTRTTSPASRTNIFPGTDDDRHKLAAAGRPGVAAACIPGKCER